MAFVYGLQTAANANLTLVAAGNRKVVQLTLLNTTTTVYFFHLYDQATAPTSGSATNWKQSYPIPPASASGGVGGETIPMPKSGLNLVNGLAFKVTGSLTLTSTTSAAVGVCVNIGYE